MNTTQWDRLLAAAADGRATAEEMERLAALLKEHPGLRDDYLFYVDTHACLAEDCADPSVALAEPSRGRFRLQPWILAGALAGASLLVAAGWFRYQSPAAVPASALASGPAASPRFLAVVTNADGALWEGGDASVMIGSALGPGLVELCEGRVELELDNGVRLAVEGPARFELESASRGLLHQGKLAATVPPQGVGFTVDTPTLSVIDLGTEFALHVAESGVSDVHVFTGEVEASLRPRSETSPTERKLLGSSVTRRARPTGSRLETVDFDPRRFVAPPPQVVAGVERVSGGVRALADAPESVRSGTYRHQYLLLFREQTGVELENALPVDLSGPGCHRLAPVAAGGSDPAPSLRDAALSPGLRIDSYFIHYDRRGTAASPRVRGTVRFVRPVLGVIAGSERLAASDDLLGSWCTGYDAPAASGRGLEGDLVTISGDRRTVTLDWTFDGNADQIRILVAAED
jgi:hypothetical protein